ncbi:pyruvate kinase [Aggregicoccus sp. 17bor-14]|uniref:pyruvate kinase n=1 Tax=Myxococcaceae TaxID=31 RepID=UPI00129CBEC4|nr:MULTISPECIES: pyruvate kinase [Myxococcaceae]MBF5043974.1 pyruvate kinase [Simulacricoccus sp. 17bor-14]MRI89725.1 pyruvate kinase [Aggregicoccus sp. 17bor-14]
MRKAKMICTLGPSSDSLEVIEGLMRAGMDVARLNFSHGTHDEHRRRVELLRKASRRLRLPVAVLQDVQGPKIRLGSFVGGSLTVRTGQRVTVTTRSVLGEGSVIPTPVQSLPRDVAKGDLILLDDGRVRLRVQSVTRRDVTCRVEVGGVLKDHKGLNLPGAEVSVPCLTPKDIEDLALGQELGVDYVALSFVRSAEDVRAARPHVARLATPLIAKIEKPQAVERLESIAAEADGVMIARGDLGVEMPLEQLPSIQKRAVRAVNRMGGIVIVATEMLESMVNSQRPTRAEVSDVANAILDGADAVMLSGETAAGKYPIEAASTMARIVEETEKGSPREMFIPDFRRPDDVSTGVAAAAVAAARQLGIDTIITYTESGHTARLISEFRPHARIVALTPNERTVDRVNMYWGVRGLRVGRLQSTDAMIRQVRRLCATQGLCAPGAAVIVVAGVPLNQPGRTNMLSVHRL